MDMPASHGCCHKEVSTAGQWNAMIQVQLANVQIDLATIAGLSLAILVALPVHTLDSAQRPASTLPQSPPPSISILRI